jgi:beta-galactosidase/beta-glucuronidase
MSQEHQQAGGVMIPRAEYPRPDLVRSAWLCLNGPWEFAFDDVDRGRTEGWHASGAPGFDRQIVVPYPFEARLSGIGDSGIHPHVWYRRRVGVPASWREGGLRILLHFGAVDYRCQVWIDGQPAGAHQGGYTPFVLDITDLLPRDPAAEATVTVWVEDTVDRAQPRGKQYWEHQSKGIFYTRTTGIWQTVWLEPVPAVHLAALRITTDPAAGTLTVAVETSQPFGGDLDLIVRDANGAEVARGHGPASIPLQVIIPQARPWSPEDPYLYDLEVSLFGPAGAPVRAVDTVRSYCGLRSIAVQGDQIVLNGALYYQKLVLDQGFFPVGQYAAPTDDDLRADVEWTKRFGFNGARKHQKVEDPRWLYWCDRLGLLVWGEMGNAMEHSAAGEEMFLHEWPAVVQRDRNHPCIVTWVPFNESWGIPAVATDAAQQDYVRRVVELTRRLDPTRPVVDNDGWEHLALSDLCTIHDYAKEGPDLRAHHAGFLAGNNAPGFHRQVYADGQRYNGVPILYTEYGGIALQPPAEDLRAADSTAQEGEAWGYAGIETSAEGMLRRFAAVTTALLDAPEVRGICYTQLTDVEQEINGLLSYDRRPKVDPEAIRRALRS